MLSGLWPLPICCLSGLRAFIYLLFPRPFGRKGPVAHNFYSDYPLLLLLLVTFLIRSFDPTNLRGVFPEGRGTPTMVISLGRSSDFGLRSSKSDSEQTLRRLT